MVYAYDSQGPLADTRTPAELYEARERAIARWRAAHTAYVIASSQAKYEMESIELEFHRRWAEAPTVRFTDPRGPMARMKAAPSMPLRPHGRDVRETRPADREGHGRMRLEGLDG